MQKKLRPYQEEVKKKIYEAWDQGHKNVLLVLPTGLGKTISFCSIAIDKTNIPVDKTPTAILVHRKELVQQICLTLAEEGINHNIIAPRPVILGIVAAQRQLLNRQFYDYNALVTVISVDTLVSRITKHEKWAKSIKLWITDEAAHVIKGNKWGRSIDFFPNAIGLGVTATPRRLDKKGLGRHVDGVFDHMVEGPSVRWGIDSGFLSKYKIAVPSSDYQTYLKKASEGSDYTRDAMIDASTKSHIVGDVVDNYLKFAKGKQAILFATDIKTATNMETQFKNEDIKAKLLTGTTSDSDRLKTLISFRKKEIQVLLNVDLFDEGLDVPGIECVILARPTMSTAKYSQMIGRGLRPAENKPHLIIIDHVGNVTRHGLPDTRRKWTLDRITKRKDKINLIRICSNPLCSAPFDRVLIACPYCGTEVTRASAGEGGGRTPLAQVDGDLELLDADTLREMFEGTKLESPEAIRAKVSYVAGGPAGIRAGKNQTERINTQKDLIETIANWAGKMRDEKYNDREIHKAFYLEFEMTIAQSLGKPKADMVSTIEKLKEVT